MIANSDENLRDRDARAWGLYLIWLNNFDARALSRRWRIRYCSRAAFLLFNAMKDTKDGRDPQHVIRDPKSNQLLHLQALSEVIPASADFKQHTQERIAEIKRTYGK